MLPQMASLRSNKEEGLQTLLFIPTSYIYAFKEVSKLTHTYVNHAIPEDCYLRSKISPNIF